MSKNKLLSSTYTIYPSENPSTGKTIIIFHGWGSSTKNFDNFAKSLSMKGFHVIVPELPFHDSRNKLENHFEKGVVQEYFWETIFKSIDEAPNFLQNLEISYEEIILLGISMGGFIATGIHAKFPSFAGLININGSGSFLFSEKIFRENDNRPEISPKEVRKLIAYDPVRATKGNSSILLMHGEEDSVVSIKGQEDYIAYSVAESIPSDITFKKYKNINHSFSEDMKEDMMQWLEKKFPS